MVTVLTGSNVFMLSQELKKLVNTFVAEHGDLALERLDGEEVSLDYIVDAVRSLPFLASHKLVVVRGLSAHKEAVDRLGELLSASEDSTDLIIYEPSIDKRSALFKRLKSLKGFKEFGELDEGALGRWLVETAKAEQASLSPVDASFLVQRIGANQQNLALELDKLITYDPAITRQTIELLTEPTPQSKIFDLLDAAFAGNTKRAIELYEDQRAQKVEPQQILAMLAWQLHVMAILAAAGTRSPEQVASDAKLSPFVVRKSRNLVKNLGLGEVKRLIHDALEIDIRSKNSALDLDEALKHYILAI